MCMHLTSEFQNTWSKNDRGEREIHKSTIIIEDLSTLLSVIDRTSGQKICKDTEELNSNINQQYQIDIYVA